MANYIIIYISASACTCCRQVNVMFAEWMASVNTLSVMHDTEQSRDISVIIILVSTQIVYH